MDEIVLRKADPFEMEEIIRFETAVFTGEQGIPAELIGAVLGARVVGTVASYEENGVVHMGRFAVRSEHRGQRIGPKLVKYAMEDLFAQGVQEIHMEARDVTVKILLALGGEVTGEPFLFYGDMVTPMVMRRERFGERA